MNFYMQIKLSHKCRFGRLKKQNLLVIDTNGHASFDPQGLPYMRYASTIHNRPS